MCDILDGDVFTLCRRYSAPPCMWISTSWWLNRGVSPESDPVVIVLEYEKKPHYMNDVLGMLYHADGAFEITDVENFTVAERSLDLDHSIHVRTKGGGVLPDINME